MTNVPGIAFIFSRSRVSLWLHDVRRPSPLDSLKEYLYSTNSRWAGSTQWCVGASELEALELGAAAHGVTSGGQWEPTSRAMVNQNNELEEAECLSELQFIQQYL